ncbi:MAG: hypothetical protein ACI4RM_04775 [Ruminococcus sp.]
MDLLKAFNSISDKVEGALTAQGYSKQKIKGNENELVSLYTSETTAYSVVYFKDKKHMVMRSCGMTDEGPDNEWKTLATWMFDPEEDTQKEADSIANDFIENCTSSLAIKRMKAAKKKKKNNEDEGNADPLFLAKRFVSYFPELKDEITYEEENYFPFRGVTFTKTSIVPRLVEYVNKASKKDVSKLCALLDKQYSNGNLDTRSIITIVILNNMPEDKYDWFKEFLSEDLNKAWGAALKYKGKKVKPAKPKKKKTTMMERLQAQQQQQQK